MLASEVEAASHQDAPLKTSSTHSLDGVVATAGRIPALDGLRAFSIALVLFSHLARETLQRYDTVWAATLASLGFFGVKVFFAISGYLITTLLLREEEKKGIVNVGEFYIRRAFRILPAAYAYLCLCAVLPAGPVSRQNLLFGFLFVENYAPHGQWLTGHLWTLGVEEQFYILWPIAFVVLPRYRVRLLALILLLVPVVNVAILHFHWPYWNMAFYSVADTLAAGCLLAMVRGDKALSRFVDGVWPLAVPLIVLACLPLSVVAGGAFFGAIKALLIRPAMNLGIVLCLDKAIQMRMRWLEVPWVRAIGVVSYSIYLWQQPFTQAAYLPSHPSMDVLLRLGLIAVCAACSYFLVEQPALRLKDRMLSAHHRRASANRVQAV